MPITTNAPTMPGSALNAFAFSDAGRTNESTGLLVHDSGLDSQGLAGLFNSTASPAAIRSPRSAGRPNQTAVNANASSAPPIQTAHQSSDPHISAMRLRRGGMLASSISL